MKTWFKKVKGNGIKFYTGNIRGSDDGTAAVANNANAGFRCVYAVITQLWLKSIDTARILSPKKIPTNIITRNIHQQWVSNFFEKLFKPLGASSRLQQLIQSFPTIQTSDKASPASFSLKNRCGSNQICWRFLLPIQPLQFLKNHDRSYSVHLQSPGNHPASHGRRETSKKAPEKGVGSL